MLSGQSLYFYYTMKNMKTLALLAIVAIASLASCKKAIESLLKKPANVDANGFTEYVIKTGNQSSEQSTYNTVDLQEMNFSVRFDESAIYSTQFAENKVDVNKLYGFSDNGAQHHEFSARFGWRYMDGKLTLHAYTYNNSVRSEKEITQIDIGKVYNCSIKVQGNQYVFSVNGKTIAVPRASTTPNGKGYRLFPYFGGNEKAPHDIHIFIKDDNY